MSDEDENSDTCQIVTGQVYNATPVNSDKGSAMNWTVSTGLSDKEAVLSEESDLEDQFGGHVEINISASYTLAETNLTTELHTNNNLPMTQNVPNVSEFCCGSSSFTDMKVHVHCGDVIYPFHKGVLMSSQSGKETEVFVHGNFEGTDIEKNNIIAENITLMATVEDSVKKDKKLNDVATLINPSEL